MTVLRHRTQLLDASHFEMRGSGTDTTFNSTRLGITKTLQKLSGDNINLGSKSIMQVLEEAKTASVALMQDMLIAPSITLLGDTLKVVAVNGSFLDPGAVTNNPYVIVTTSNLDLTVPGDYEITYTVILDSATGQSISKTRNVKVINLTQAQLELANSNQDDSGSDLTWSLNQW